MHEHFSSFFNSLIHLTNGYNKTVYQTLVKCGKRKRDQFSMYKKATVQIRDKKSNTWFLKMCLKIKVYNLHCRKLNRMQI